MNSYERFKIYTDDKLSKFPVIFALTRDDFKEGLKALGVYKEDITPIGCGYFIRKQDKEEYIKLNESLNKELRDNIDKSNEFVYEMFMYELEDNEYSINGNDTQVLKSCGLNLSLLLKDDRLRNIYLDAREDYLRINKR